MYHSIDRKQVLCKEYEIVPKYVNEQPHAEKIDWYDGDKNEIGGACRNCGDICDKR